MVYGSKPADGGNLLLSAEDRKKLLEKEPTAEKYIRPFLNAEEFLNNQLRYCLWLVDCPPNELRQLKEVSKRTQAVQQMRAASTKIPTQKLASRPTLFAEIRQKDGEYLLVPRHSSENRDYIPIGFFSEDMICGDANLMIPKATLYEFGVMTSIMHNAWMRTTCSSLKSNYRYSASIVYNNFPWPLDPTTAQKSKIESAAQAVLDARAAHPDSSLADLYDPLSMPPNLTKAHQQLDKAVDAAYGKTKFGSEAERVAFLFELYQHYTAPTAPVAAAAKPKTRGKTV